MGGCVHRVLDQPASLIIMFVFLVTFPSTIASAGHEDPVCHDLCFRFVGALVDPVPPICPGVSADVPPMDAGPKPAADSETCIGGAVFEEVDAEDSYTIGVADASGLADTAAGYRIDGGSITTFCGSIDTSSVSDQSTITVWVYPPGTISSCTGGAATGVITLKAN